MITHGTFGPLLAEVRRAMETSKQMRWVRWESGPEGNRAVFGFVIPAAESRYFEGAAVFPIIRDKIGIEYKLGIAQRLRLIHRTAQFCASKCSLMVSVR